MASGTYDRPAMGDVKQKHELQTRVERKDERAEQTEAHRVKIKRLVWARDHGRCRCCGGQAVEMHELKPRSLGGTRSLYNSIAVCTTFGAAEECHRRLQNNLIRWRFIDAAIGADGAIEFERDGRVWLSRPGERIERHRRSWQRD